MAVETLVEPPPSTLSGVARVLVNAGKLNAKTAEELSKSARERKSSFVTGGSAESSGRASSERVARSSSLPAWT